MQFSKLSGISREEWNAMSLYGRFEQVVTWILTLFIAIIIAVALFRLVTTVLQLLVSGLLNPLSLEFEIIFGTIMTLLIAMEFNHSILETMNRFHRIIQVKTVVLIGILALVRKFIIVNIETTSATTIAALAFALIALGALYWLMGEKDKKGGAVRQEP
jgi:uncharacterized membrane protein (DUF373 family)